MQLFIDKVGLNLEKGADVEGASLAGALMLRLHDSEGATSPCAEV